MSGVGSDDRLSGWFDGELPPDERAGVESVVGNSPEAQQLLSDFATLSNLLQDRPRPEVPPEFTARVLQAAERSMLLSTGAAVNVPEKAVVVREPEPSYCAGVSRSRSRHTHRRWLNIVLRSAALVLVLGLGMVLWQNVAVNNREDVAANKTDPRSRLEPAHRSAALPAPAIRSAGREDGIADSAAHRAMPPGQSVDAPAADLPLVRDAKETADKLEAGGLGGAPGGMLAGDADSVRALVARKEEGSDFSAEGTLPENAPKPASDIQEADMRIVGELAETFMQGSSSGGEKPTDPEIAIAEAILPPNDAEAELVTNEIVDRALANSRPVARNARTTPSVVPLQVTVPDVEKGMIAAAVTFQENWIPTDVDVPADAVMRILNDTSNASELAIVDGDKKAELEKLMTKAAEAKVEQGGAASRGGEPQYNAYLVNTTVGQLRGWVSLMKQRNAYMELSVGDGIPSSQLPGHAQSQLTNMLFQNTSVPLEFTNRDRTIALYDQYRADQTNLGLDAELGFDTENGVAVTATAGERLAEKQDKSKTASESKLSDELRQESTNEHAAAGEETTANPRSKDDANAPVETRMARKEKERPAINTMNRRFGRNNEHSLGMHRRMRHPNANPLATPGEPLIGNSNFLYHQVLPEEQKMASSPLPQTPPALALLYNATASWSYALQIDEKQLPIFSTQDMKSKALAPGRNAVSYQNRYSSLQEQTTSKDNSRDSGAGNALLNDIPVDLRPVQVLIVLRQGAPAAGATPATSVGKPLTDIDATDRTPAAPAVEPQPEPVPGPMQ